MAESITIPQAIEKYLAQISMARSARTHRTYGVALKAFSACLHDHIRSFETAPIDKLNEDAVIWFLDDLKASAPATERLYLAAMTSFYEYLAAERLSEINLPRLRYLIRQRARRPGIRLPQFPQDEIGLIIDYAINFAFPLESSPEDRLRILRDRAFLVTLADTGLRVHEACELRRGDVDWSEQRAVLIGKGDKQAVVRFSQRAIQHLQVYLRERGTLDGKSGKAMAALPLFARHDRGAGKKVKPISTNTGRNIVADWARLALGDNADARISPHSFRHYFVTNVLRGSGGNLKLAQELARHSNIAVTQRYAHLSNDELDQQYNELFNCKV